LKRESKSPKNGQKPEKPSVKKGKPDDDTGRKIGRKSMNTLVNGTLKLLLLVFCMQGDLVGFASSEMGWSPEYEWDYACDVPLFSVSF
jgi:hypothetical protein